MIRNKSRDKVLCKEKHVLKSMFSKAIGLMFHFKIKNTGYVFVFSKPRRQSMHMFFVFFPIDVLFLDKEKKVVEIKENFRPFTFYNSEKRVKYVIELAQGAVKKSKTEVGHKIIF